MIHANLQALAGGLLIGAAAAVLLLSSGRIAGISGILGRIVVGEAGPRGWRLAFVAGLVLPALIASAAGWGAAPVLQGGYALAVVAGMLVGVGTGWASGCTSGHGVCGLANLSTRSLVATLVFMGTAGLTVFVQRHVA